MKKYNLLFAFVCIVFASTNAQTLKKTFYDLNGTKPKEVYHVNAKGEKNGSYKSYFDDGLIGVEANYKNGSLDGAYKEYTGYGGKSCLVKSATYKDGNANGAAVYYSSQECNVIASQGNLVNGKRNGIWTFFEETSKSFAEGFKYMTYTQKVDGDIVLEDSKIVYYHPSKKIFSEFKGNVKVSYSPDGKVIGEETFNDKKELVEEKYFYLNGVVAENNKYYVESGNKISENSSWYENGKVKKKEGYSNGSTLLYYEGYNVDGSKDANMLQIEKNEQKEKEETASQKLKFNTQTRNADSLFNIKSYNEASEEYSSMSRSADIYIERRGANDTSNLGFLKGKKQYAQAKINEIKKIAEMSVNVKKQFSEITTKYNKFTKLFGGVTETTKVFNVDVNTTNYPKGEYLFTKADSHYKELEAAYKKETDIPKGLETGKKLIEILDKLISLGDTDTKDLDKKLKKAKTKEEETQLLGF